MLGSKKASHSHIQSPLLLSDKCLRQHIEPVRGGRRRSLLPLLLLLLLLGICRDRVKVGLDRLLGGNSKYALFMHCHGKQVSITVVISSQRRMIKKLKMVGWNNRK